MNILRSYESLFYAFLILSYASRNLSLYYNDFYDDIYDIVAHGCIPDDDLLIIEPQTDLK